MFQNRDYTNHIDQIFTAIIDYYNISVCFWNFILKVTSVFIFIKQLILMKILMLRQSTRIKIHVTFLDETVAPRHYSR